MPISSIHPRFARATSLATRMLLTGLKRRNAKTAAASSVPRIPARAPKNHAVNNGTALKARGTQTRQEWSAARALAPRAAVTQITPPISESMRPRKGILAAARVFCALLVTTVRQKANRQQLEWQNSGLLREKSRAGKRAVSTQHPAGNLSGLLGHDQRAAKPFGTSGLPGHLIHQDCSYLLPAEC